MVSYTTDSLGDKPMNKTPMTELEYSGLLNHHLSTDEPSQLSDTFRAGIAWALRETKENTKPIAEVVYMSQALLAGNSKMLQSIAVDVTLDKNTKLYLHPQDKLPELNNIREVELCGDFTVVLSFASCRSASAFKQHINKLKESA